MVVLVIGAILLLKLYRSKRTKVVEDKNVVDKDHEAQASEERHII